MRYWLIFVAVFVRSQNHSKAMVAHEKALEWQELFDLAARMAVTEEDVVATAYRMAGSYHRKLHYLSLTISW
jgi:elongator complex protein 1